MRVCARTALRRGQASLRCPELRSLALRLMPELMPAAEHLLRCFAWKAPTSGTGRDDPILLSGRDWAWRCRVARPPTKGSQ